MAVLRFLFPPRWRIVTRLIPRHRPLLQETEVGPIRLVRLLDERQAMRIVERQAASAFAEAQRRALRRRGWRRSA